METLDILQKIEELINSISYLPSDKKDMNSENLLIYENANKIIELMINKFKLEFF